MKITEQQLKNLIVSVLRESSLSSNDDLAQVFFNEIDEVSYITSNLDSAYLTTDNQTKLEQVYRYFMNIKNNSVDVYDEINTRGIILDFFLEASGLEKDSKIKKSIVDNYRLFRMSGKGISPFLILGFVVHVIKYIDYSSAEKIHDLEMEALGVATAGFSNYFSSNFVNKIVNNKKAIFENLLKYFVSSTSVAKSIVKVYFKNDHPQEVKINNNSREESIKYFTNLFAQIFSESAVKAVFQVLAPKDPDKESYDSPSYTNKGVMLDLL